MADADNTPDDAEPQSKPFIVPAAAGVVVGAGGAVGAAHFVGKDHKKTEEALTKAEEALETAKKAATGTPEEITKTVAKEQGLVNKLSALRTLNEEEKEGKAIINILKRPISLVGRGGTRPIGLLIVGGSTVLGAVTYMGARAMMSPKQEASSFVDREQQKDASRGADVAQGV